MSDADHARAVRDATQGLTTAIRNAASSGLDVKLSVGAGTGFTPKDKITHFPIPLVAIARPL